MYLKYILAIVIGLSLITPGNAQQLNWKETSNFSFDAQTDRLAGGGDKSTESYILSHETLWTNDIGSTEISDFMLQNAGLTAGSDIPSLILFFTFEDTFSLSEVDQNAYSISYSSTDKTLDIRGPNGSIALLNNITLAQNDVLKIEKTDTNKIVLQYNTQQYLITDNFLENGRVALYTNAQDLSFQITNNGFRGPDPNPSIVVLDGDKNWVMAKTYDNAGILTSASVGYYDCLGKPTQNQSRDFDTNRTWASEVRYDYQGRPALQTYSAPLAGTSNDFQYSNSFVQQLDGTELTTGELEGDPGNPPSLNSNLEGSVAWYFSNNNNLEPYQDIAENRPYVRNIYDELNPGNVRAVSGGKILDANGNGQDDGLLDRNPQGFSYTVPAAQEMYYVFGKNYFEGPDHSLGKEVILTSHKNVSIDPHGNEVVSFSDSDGNILATARSGGVTNYEIVVTIKNQNYVDVHIPNGITNNDVQWLGNASGYQVWDLRTGLQKTPWEVTGGHLYRIVYPNTNGGTTYITQAGGINTEAGAKGIRYPVNYYDYSLNYYDEAGRLKTTTQPNGFDTAAFDLSTPAPNHSMLTSYVQNASGELKATSSPDEGSVQFVYREDGQIRFSRNEKQGLAGEFSYTNYDALGRPIESGAYAGMSTTFTALSNNAPQCVAASRITASPGEVTKDGVNTWHSAGFYSSEQTGIENFRISFQVPKELRAAIGVSQTPFTGNVKDHTQVEYTMYFRWNQVSIYHLGQLLTLSAASYDPDDTMHIERIGNALTFKKNQEILHVVYLEEPLADYVIDGSIFSANHSVTNISLKELDQFGTDTPTFPPLPGPDDPIDPNNCREQVFTLYDVPDTSGLHAVLYPNTFGGIQGIQREQQFVAGNVSKTWTETPETNTTWYSYDVYGRVEWMVQNINGLGPKTIDYEYDEATGQVTRVLYQKEDANERFTHKYTYNEVGQLVTVETSRDNLNFVEHARYTYYETGELKRIILAEGLQGTDYVYNLGRQLKAINHPNLTNTDDPGNDGNNAFGMILDYYQKDYTRNVAGIGDSPSGINRFDGNIKGSRWGTQGIHTNGNQSGYSYQYNDNGWLSNATFSSINGNTYTSGVSPDYSVSSLTYDANGNIQTLRRTRDFVGTSNLMDDLQYHYIEGTNQLDYVDDTSGNTEDDGDIKDQNSGNYLYNEIGQLVHNSQDDLTYSYFINGLVNEVYTQDNQGIKQGVAFTYDDRGHRINKKQFSTQPGVGESNTYYVRDANGQPMAIYNMNDGSTSEILIPTIEYPIYGVSRIGVGNNEDVYKYQLTDHLGNVRGVIQRDYTPQVVLSEDFEQGVVNTPPWHSFQNTSVSVLNGQLRADVSNIPDKNHIKLSFTAVAHKTYTIAFDVNLTNTPYTLYYGIDGNDLGSENTNGTVSFQYTSLQGGTTDIHFNLDTDPTVPVFANYYTLDNVIVTDISTNNTPIMLAYKDYYPFGMPMPRRNVEGEYRYGYQGEYAETDPETEMPAFELRLWDARLGRWLTTDPAGQYNSPYMGMGNNPISRIDPDGGYDVYQKQADGSYKWVEASDDFVILDEEGNEINKLEFTFSLFSGFLKRNSEYDEAINYIYYSGIASWSDYSSLTAHKLDADLNQMAEGVKTGIEVSMGAYGILKNPKALINFFKFADETKTGTILILNAVGAKAKELKSITSPRFWKSYGKLPDDI